jgi:hypothetical protein
VAEARQVVVPGWLSQVCTLYVHVDKKLNIKEII